ncbi:MAG: extracellular solute-binding protein [Deinococcus-Thermus bacterium]|jgi:multiple sugar transport system substrate-binding protein|nr:extracellular solute-binding protein [Deinococcota bacterium]
MTRRIPFALLAAIAALLFAPMASAQTEISLGRFFGACEDAGTDMAAATGEACIIQTIINAFDAEDNGVSVNTLPTDWGNYYDQIKASYAGGNPPDVHVMHRSSLAEFASLGALAALPAEDLAAAGIDTSDWTDGARAGVTWDGEIYGMPMDLHANLWHVNMDLMAQAGLVNDDGTPILPSSPEEMLEHAAMVEEATGVDYLAADFAQFPIGVRLVLALMWQQGAELIAGDTANVDSPEAAAAVESIVALFDAGYADPELNYADSQQAFLDGEAAVLVNGTWVVDFYDAQASDPEVPLTDYYVASFPAIFDEAATWADSHMWVVPSNLQARSQERYEAALELLAWINDASIHWARTGHLSVRESVLSSEEYRSLPHRDEYADTVEIARDVERNAAFSAIQDVLNRRLQSIWLTGEEIEAALSAADDEVQSLLD